MDEDITVRCVCGWETSGSEEAVVTATREHGERLHNMTASREQILAMAVVPSSQDGRTSDGRTPDATSPTREA
jgi:predicted small metal-binding protein